MRPATGPRHAEGGCRPEPRRASEEPAVAVDELAVGVDLAAGPKVADQVPVERGAVEPARLRIRRSEREVDRPADLLVEKDVAREDVDRVVQAERELADAPRPVIDRDHLAQEAFAPRCRRLDHLTAAEPQADVVDLPALEHRGVREADLAFDARLERRGVDPA